MHRVYSRLLKIALGGDNVKRVVKIAVGCVLLIAAVVVVVLVLKKDDHSSEVLREPVGETTQVSPTEFPSVTKAPTPTLGPIPSVRPNKVVGSIDEEDMSIYEDTEGEGENSESEEESAPIQWSGGHLSTSDYERVCREVANLYSKEIGDEYKVSVCELDKESYEKFSEPCAFYMDKRKFLYLNMKLSITGEETVEKYITFKVAYVGRDLTIVSEEEIGGIR